MTVRESKILVAGVASIALLTAPVATAGAAESAANSTAESPASDTATGMTVTVAADSSGSNKAIKRANRWAKKSAVKEARKCRSGNNYQLKQQGYYGAYGLSTRTWRKFGGKKYASRADKASKGQQNAVARKYVKATSLSRVGCARSDWMNRVYSTAPKTTLSQMLIPGTHDSGTAGIRTSDPCTTTFVDGAEGLSALSKMNPCVFAQLYRAQDLTLAQQLAQGVRYFDLRVGIPADEVPASVPSGTTKPEDVPLVLSHKLVAEPLAEALAGVQRFVAKHPKEQIILDFQEFNLPKDPALADYYKGVLDDLLHKYAPGNTAPVCDSAWSKNTISVADNKLGTAVPVKKAWKKGVSVLVYFLADEKPANDPCYRTRWASGGFLWPNTDDPATSTSDNHSYLKERRSRIKSGDCTDTDGNYWCGIYVGQMQLTPSTSTYVDCVQNPTNKCSLQYLAGQVNDGIVANIKKWRFQQNLPANIAMVDWIERSDPRIPDGLITLNWRIAG